MWVGNMQKGIIHCLQSMKAGDNSSLRGDTSVEVQECAALNDVTLCNDSWYLHSCSGSMYALLHVQLFVYNISSNVLCLKDLV